MIALTASTRSPLRAAARGAAPGQARRGPVPCRRGPGGASGWGGILLALALAATPAPAPGLDEHRAISQYARDTYGERDGVPPSLWDVRQTRDGYLWLATQTGLTRFDGEEFSTTLPMAAGAATNWIWRLFEDPSGDLYASAYKSDLLVKRTNRLEQVRWAKDAAIQGANFVLHDPAGRRWLGSERGLHVSKGGAARRLGAEEGLPDGPAVAGLLDPAGRVVVATKRGVFRSSEDGRFHPWPPRTEWPQISSLAVSRDGAVWVGTAERGLARISPEGRTRWIGPAEGLPASNVNSVLEDGGGNLWAGTMSGLYRVTGGRVERAPPGDPLASSLVRGLAEDREGSLWVATESTGLVRLRDGDFVTVGRDEGLPNEDVRSVSPSGRGGLWVGSQHGLHRFLDGQVVESYGEERGLTRKNIRGLLEARDGALWFGTSGGGAGRLSGGRFQWFGHAEGLRDLVVRAIHEDGGGGIWLGTGAGLLRLRGGGFEPVPGADGKPWTLHVTAMVPDGRGGLWVGTEMQGLHRVSAGRVEPFDDVGRGVLITALASDADGALWISTLGRGIWRLRDGRLVRFTVAQGLHEDVSYSVVDDGRGFLWSSGDRGVTRIPRQDIEEVAEGRAAAVRAVAYGRSDGMRTRECNGGSQPSGTRAPDGRLWFATSRGLVVVDPARLGPEVPAPPIRIEVAILDGRPQEVADHLDVPPGTARIALRFGALGFAGRERARFRYRLDGVDSGWVEARGERQAQYMRLPPGEHTFRVQASMGNGPWVEPGASMQLHVLPTLWQSPWFRLAAAAAVVLLPTGALVVRARVQRAREAELRRRIEEAVSKVQVLSGLLPICAWCHKVRDDRGYWSRIEAYVSAHSAAEFSHGICPTCFAKMESEAPSDS